MGGKLNHISHHPCGQETILVRNRGSDALLGLVVPNSHKEKLAENPQTNTIVYIIVFSIIVC